MEYNYCRIGQKLREEREKAGLSQDELVSQINVSRNTLSACENGKKMLQLGDMLKLCSIFDCELGYLLCEHDCKTRTRADVQEETGLTESAIMCLRELTTAALMDEKAETVLWFLNRLIEEKYTLEELASCADRYEYIKRHAGPPSEDNVYVSFADGAERITPLEASELKLMRCSDYIKDFVKSIKREEV